MLVVGITVGAALYEPGDLVVIIPFILVLGGALAAFMGFMYRRRTGQARTRTETNAWRLPAPGSAVKADASGLTIDGTLTPWSSLTIEEVEITQTNVTDTPTAWIEWLVLSSGGRQLMLDCVMIKNGRAVVDAAWRALRPAR